MEKIGEGYYYSVYAHGPDRVVKKQTSTASKLSKLIAWYGHDPVLLAGKISQLEADALDSITRSKKLADMPELRAILGHPVFINDYEYEQDRATPLESFLDAEGEFLAYVEEYIDANILLWEFGYGEVVHNFTLNAGVSAVTGKVILLDFNDLTQRKEEVTKDIETKKWTTQVSMARLKESHPSLHAKVEPLLESALTLDKLDAHWASRC